jgi:hypothetical protein
VYNTVRYVVFLLAPSVIWVVSSSNALYYLPDLDSTYHPDADPDSGFLFDADPIRHFTLMRILIQVQMLASKI